MKTLVGIMVLLALTGCASSSTKATAYCDDNWKGRYDSWQSCYQLQLPLQNKGLKAIGSVLNGAGSGLQNAQRNTVNCTTFGNQTTCR